MGQQSVSNKPVSAPITNATLPSVKQLIIESWELLTKKALKLLFLGLFSTAVYFILVIVGIVLIIGVGAINISSFSHPDAVLEALTAPGFIGPAVTVFILWVISLIAVGTALQAGMLFLLKDSTEEASVISYFKKGFSYIVPLIVVSAITCILIFGSLFVFVLPALIISLFLIFTTYAVVLDNKKGMEAIKMSVGVVSQNFGAIMGRIIILWLLSFAVQMLIGALPNEEPSVTMFYVLISVVSSLVIGWFGLAYVFKLYQYARAAYDESKPSSMTWMWVVSVLGWVIGGMLIAGMVSAIGNTDLQNMIQESINNETQKLEGKDVQDSDNFKLNQNEITQYPSDNGVQQL